MVDAGREPTSSGQAVDADVTPTNASGGRRLAGSTVAALVSIHGNAVAMR